MATLERLIAEVGRAFGPKRIWLTEYGYQTGAYGVTQQRQAELLGQSGLRAHRAARVDMLIHYLVKDEPQASRFQSGLFNIAGRPKLAALRSRCRSPRPGAAAASSSSGGRSGRAPASRRTGSRSRGGGAVALQRRHAADKRARLLQHGGGGAGRCECPHLSPQDAPTAPPSATASAPRPRLRSGRARATGSPRRLRLARRLARDGALPLLVRDRLLPRVGARPAAVGRAPPGARRAARHLFRGREPARLRGRARARLAAAARDRARDAAERGPRSARS